MLVRTPIAPKMEGNHIEVTFKGKQTADEQSSLLGSHRELENTIAKSRNLEA